LQAVSKLPANLKQKFFEQIELTEKILSQTEQKLEGNQSIPERIVSFHDSEARPIRKGKLNKAVEFGANVATGPR
jgi:IS5 family transposase